jgi:endonuclease G
VGVLDEQIEKARRRAEGIDLVALAAASRDKAPIDLASPQALMDRRRMLGETLGEDGDAAFERLIAGNELQPVNYLPHGVVAARPICRLILRSPAGQLEGYATGFLVAPGVLLTNNHVFPSAASATQSTAQFDYELNVFDKSKVPAVFALQPQRLFLTSADLDFSLVAVDPGNAAGQELASYGFLPLVNVTGKAVEGEWLTIIQHPGGDPKQVCIRENKLLTRTDEVLWYSTDTLGGSSGSPVFNNSWQVVALHHKGVPETKNGVMQTVDGRDYDPARDREDAIKWLANEGIRVSRLVSEMRKLAPNEPLLDRVFNMTAAEAQQLLDGFARTLPFAAEISTLMQTTTTTEKSMPTRSITLTLDVSDDGGVSIGSSSGGAQESFLAEATARKKSPPPEYNVPFDNNYAPSGSRKGFDTAYLGNGFEVQLPGLGALKSEMTPLGQGVKPGKHGPGVLDYRGYSLVMHARRKFAIYTAANIDGGNRFKLGRPHDEWRFDPRIDRSAQIGGYYYASNQFDRGHLTRYEDMEYGSDVKAALQSAADTLHFTNCTPQHAKFNQGKELWQGLEQLVLEQSIKSNDFAACVFTGPVLDDGDPVWDRYKDVQYPLQFWKIAVAKTSGNKLFAAGFVLDQSDVIAQYGIEATVEVPFSAFKTYQVPIAEIERLTGLTFTSGASGQKSLNDADPLRSGSPGRRRAASTARRGALESATVAAPPPGYVPLADHSDVVLE